MTQEQTTSLMTDQEVYLYATDFRRAILGDAPSDRMCVAISAPLCSALRVLEVPVELVQSDFGPFNHVFLDLLDGQFLDPTADQFNWLNVGAFPAIYVGPPTLIHRRAKRYEGTRWDDLLSEFKRLQPSFAAIEVGAMVKSVLKTLPPEMIQWPSA
jgi:hypothetical protein